MNDAVRVETDGLLTTAELAARPDFTVGLAAVSPSSRTIAGPGGTADVEPRVMQVLVVLADAAGEVVTRGTLFDRCWGGVYVGDDSLNRTIGAIRKLAAEIAAGSFEIETIPRTGYRLTSDNLMGPDSTAVASVSRLAFSRRALIGGSVVAAAALAGGVGWWWTANREDPRFAALMDQANDQIVKETADEKTVKSLDGAIAMRPDNARAWGLQALLKSYLAPASDPRDSPRLVAEAEKAARRALSLDPNQPDALLAMFELEGSTLDWTSRDKKLRRIVAIDPNHVRTLAELASLTSATGLVRESWTWNERALAFEPLSPAWLGTRALKLWVLGRTSEADKVSDQLRALYPTNDWAWFVRTQIYAFTGRVRAAIALLDGSAIIPEMAALWRGALPAIEHPSPANIAKAREYCLRASEASGMTSNEAVLILSALGQLDTAFDIANGSLSGRGPLVPRRRGAAENAGWRVNTQWMWTPPVAAMRADPRFLPLCESVGLTDYWHKRGVRPDYQRA